MLVTLATVARSNIFPLAQHCDRRLIRKVLSARKVEGETEREKQLFEERDWQLRKPVVLKVSAEAEGTWSQWWGPLVLRLSEPHSHLLYRKQLILAYIQLQRVLQLKSTC